MNKQSLTRLAQLCGEFVQAFSTDLSQPQSDVVKAAMKLYDDCHEKMQEADVASAKDSQYE